MLGLVRDLFWVVVTVSCWFRVFNARIRIMVRSKLTNRGLCGSILVSFQLR